ncbi:MFS transporter [Anaeromicropila herbilytica]|uniref:MFS transporter n=1 Tax=Anaeromicropila herbilytica TaxID=2785025 RepID=UPI00232A1AA9|nr:MFS transporter [Anaeromicropila herbilytica]
MFWGPISDKYGRKPVLMVGLSLYVIASVLCVFAILRGCVIDNKNCVNESYRNISLTPNKLFVIVYLQIIKAYAFITG